MILAVENQKGGATKSTTALNIGACLSQSYNVLLVDLEPQADLTDFAGIRDFIPALDMTDVLKGRAKIENVIMKGTQYDLAINSKKMKSEAIQFTGILSKELERLKDRYDYIIIDTPPQVNANSVEALYASDYVIIPTLLERASVRAVGEVLEAVESIKKSNAALKDWFILPSIYKDSKDCREYLEELSTTYRGHVLPEIRSCKAIPSGQKRGLDIFAYRPKSNAAQDFIRATEELINKTH